MAHFFKKALTVLHVDGLVSKAEAEHMYIPTGAKTESRQSLVCMGDGFTGPGPGPEGALWSSIAGMYIWGFVGNTKDHSGTLILINLAILLLN